MKDAIAKVTAFHVALGQRVGDVRQPDIRVDRDLRLALMREELAELVFALSAEDVVGVADALADIVYVVLGSAITWGIPLAEVFDEVHASNMTKIGGERRSDGKVLKPPGYKRPDIAGVLAAARERQP